MRTRLLLPTILVVVLTLATGCGSSGSGAKASTTSVAGAGATSTVGGGAGSGSGSGGSNQKIDCVAVKKAAGNLVVDVQLLAQLESPENATAIKNKEIGNLDIDQFITDMETLHQLDGYSSPLGDPKAAVDFYLKAGNAAKTLLASDPIDQAAIDTYVKQVGSTSDLLSHQTAISGGIDAAHC